MATLSAFMPGEDAAAIYNALTDYALTIRDDRSMDQRRLDALRDAILNPGGIPGLHAEVQVIVEANTLLGRNDHPGEVVGYGPVTAEVARIIAADTTGTWRRILPTRHPGSDGLRPHPLHPTSQPQRIRAHPDRTCRFPRLPATRRRADLDTTPCPTRPDPPTQATSPHSARRHHRLKGSRKWKVTHGDNGELTWTSPTGHHYQTKPEPYLEPPPPPPPEEPPPF